MMHRDKSKSIRQPRTRRQKIALLSLSVIALVSAYILAAPYLPKLYYKLFKPTINATVYEQAAQSAKKQSITPVAPTTKPGNRLILPDIGVDTEVLEGNSISVIGKNQGVWHETRSVTPDENGNIVIAGHRFLYRATNGGWFYNLPELKVGAKIYLTWNKTVYAYEIFNTRSVLPTQVDIRDPDPTVPRKLTLYTCYPLGSTAKRFVIEARQL